MKFLEKKINKSGRFDPQLIKNIEERVEVIGLSNLSQALEFLCEIGYASVDKSVYTQISKKASANRRTYAEQVKLMLQKSLEGQL